jgi:hypothetical protein
VETVQATGEIKVAEIFYLGLRQVRDRFITQRVTPESSDNRPLAKVFHFSEPPAVTTGLIAFVFDIREVLKVASGLLFRVFRKQL